ncbi:MAG: HlyD family type I secretion periplasmic adaptor subunit [Desulfobulbaceae bacterium]|nr:HlyD family type I secretion periplasmic adaptor subunit [Desulfobulbaceae bacterium]
MADEARRDYDFLPAALEVLERPPAPLARLTALALIALATLIICWAIFARMDIVVSASGRIVPKGKVKVIQPLESGIVRAIHVHNGQRVRQGEMLISLDSVETEADSATAHKELAATELAISRLQAQLDGDAAFLPDAAATDAAHVKVAQDLLLQSMRAQQEKLAALEKEIERCRAEQRAGDINLDKLATALPLSERLLSQKKALAAKHLISQAELLQAELDINTARHELAAARNGRTLAEAQLAKAREERSLAVSEYKRDILARLSEMTGKRDQLVQQLEKAENRQAHSLLRAPIDGLVQQLAAHTVGGVATAAQPLLVIAPSGGDLEVDAQVLDKDIGFVAAGQPVSVKVAAFPHTRHGDLPGLIEWVARDSVTDEKLGQAYPIRVSLKSYELPNSVNEQRGLAAPGMTVIADIKVGKRRVIEYFLGPILRYRDESLREM